MTGGGAPEGHASELAPLVERTQGPQPGRRIFHAVNGLVIAGVLVVVEPGWTVAVGILAALTVGAFLLDAARFAVPALNRLFFRVLRPFASPREARGAASSSWYLLGCTLAVAIFPRELAVASILVLALADPAASWGGRRWGRTPLGTGTRLGTGIFVAVAALVLLPFVGLPAALLVAVGTAALEVVRWPLDDNLVVPLATGALAWSLVPLF